jgi:hypothetical protein
MFRFSRELKRVTGLIAAMDLPQDSLPVLVPTYDRPEYLAQVLQAISVADGISEVLQQLFVPSRYILLTCAPLQTVVVVSQDGNNPEIAKLIDQYAVKGMWSHYRH